MELEFDKEIDTILRKAGSTSARYVVTGEHLDADAIAAFAEGALPQNVRVQYTSHLADCGRCTGILAQVAMSMPAEESRPAAVVAPAESTVPWYKALLATRNLSLAVGSLAVLFAVMIGYMAFRTGADRNSTVTQVTAPANPVEEPFRQAETSDTATTGTSNSNAASAAMANSAAPKSNTAMTAAPVANAVGNIPGVGSAPKEESLSARAVQDLPLSAVNPSDAVVGGTGTAKQPADAAKPTAAAPPPPPAPLARSADAERSADVTTMAESTSPQAQASRDSRLRAAQPPSAKMSQSRSGPIQNQQNQINNRSFEMPVTRSAGGKTFNNRDRVWYDSSYSGQATTNVRRGSEEFQKLDSGLRSIANNIGGTVVVIWKGKAYRIQ